MLKYPVSTVPQEAEPEGDVHLGATSGGDAAEVADA
jgi:hypothetical protein